MFHYHERLDPLLGPRDYSSEAFFAAEQEGIFRPGWSYVAPTDELRRPGDYVAAEVHGVPVVVRNFGGEVRAFTNVCVHRHCLIVRQGCGHAEQLKCQYHGWEYGARGQVTKIPDGPSFKGLRVKELGLRPVEVETCGALVLVRLQGGGPSFRESLGPFLAEFLRYYGHHRLVDQSVVEHPVNWKVIVENAVESYHVPQVHGSSFGNYGPEEIHGHLLEPGHTTLWFKQMPPEKRTERLQRIWRDFTNLERAGGGRLARRAEFAWRAARMAVFRLANYGRFRHTHVFPNLLLTYWDHLCICEIAEPLGPERTRFTRLLLAPRITDPGDWRGRALQQALVAAATPLTRAVGREDAAIWQQAHQGLKHSSHRGALSCREERVYAFQQWLRRAMDGAKGPASGPA